MGQLTPYLIAGVDLARPTAFSGSSPLDAVNTVFSGPGAVQAVGTVGMGFQYQVTPNFAFGMEARAVQGQQFQLLARAGALLSPSAMLLSLPAKRYARIHRCPSAE